MKPIYRRNCANCDYLNKGKVACEAADYGSPIRKCLIGLLRTELLSMPPNFHVLEIGCGTWPFIRNSVREIGATWTGVDPAESSNGGELTIATHIGTAEKLGFSTAEFDYVISNQSIEHWHEFGTSFAAGIAEIWRVLRPGGVISLNFPINFHGHPIFNGGNLSAIHRLLPQPWWEGGTMEVWRDNCFPLSPYQPNIKREVGAKVGVIRATKTTVAVSCSRWAITRAYIASAQWALVSPMPKARAFILRAILRRSFLHWNPLKGGGTDSKA